MCSYKLASRPPSGRRPQRLRLRNMPVPEEVGRSKTSCPRALPWDPRGTRRGTSGPQQRLLEFRARSPSRESRMTARPQPLLPALTRRSADVTRVCLSPACGAEGRLCCSGGHQRRTANTCPSGAGAFLRLKMSSVTVALRADLCGSAVMDSKGNPSWETEKQVTLGARCPRTARRVRSGGSRP